MIYLNLLRHILYYISYLSILLIIINISLVLKPCKNRVEWFFYVLIFYSIAIINHFSILLDLWPAFHPADESYFYLSSMDLRDGIANGRKFFDVLFSLTWNYKYFGFISFDFFATYGALNTTEAHKLSIVLSLCSCYLIFLRYVLNDSGLIKSHIRFIIVPAFMYMATLNYRDGFLSIIIYFIFKAIYERNIPVLIFNTVILIYFRMEFVQLILISTLVAVFISHFNNRFLIITMSMAVFIVLLIIFNGKESFDVDSYRFLPLSFNGVSLVHEIFTYYDGEHYYQGNFLLLVLSVFSAFSFLIFKTFIIKLLLSEYSDFSYMKRLITNVFVIFYCITLILYTFLLDGFQDRIKVAFVCALVLILSLMDEKYTIKNNRLAILISFGLSLIVLVRNLRWIL